MKSCTRTGQRRDGCHELEKDVGYGLVKMSEGRTTGMCFMKCGRGGGG